MNILSVESSCDETAVAVVRDGREILTDCIASQVELHKLYGGVVPEIASRKHIEAIYGLADQALETSGLRREDLDAIAVTYAPGLIGAVLVGVNFAKAAAYAMGLPLVPVHHIRGHIAANYLAYPDLEPPFICLVVSGDEEKYPLPHTKLSGNPLDMSFSGLKTAALNLIHMHEQKGESVDVPSLCASFSKAVSEMLVPRTMQAVKESGYRKLAIAGGVAANSRIRADFKAACEKLGATLYTPPLSLCGDNGAMIGSQGYYEFLAGTRAGQNLNAFATRSIEQSYE